MNARIRWAQLLTVVGCVAMLLGGIDPMEGSPILLSGSLLLLLGALMGRAERAVLVSRCWVFGLVAVGVAALWSLSALGGVGGRTGRSLWWLVLVLPMPAGWSFGFWSAGAPRWFTYAGIVSGLFYLLTPVLIALRPHGPIMPLALVTVAAFGLLNLGGCIWRLRRNRSGP